MEQNTDRSIWGLGGLVVGISIILAVISAISPITNIFFGKVNDSVQGEVDPLLNYYTLSYELDGGGPRVASEEEDFHSISALDGDYVNVTTTIPVKLGGAFQEKGWQIEGTDLFIKPGEQIELVEDMTLIAVWELNKYNVSYDVQGNGRGVHLPAAEDSHVFTVGVVEHGSSYRIPLHTPTKEGYTFLHWLTDNGTQFIEGSTIYNIHESIKLSAQWRRNEYDIIYDLQGGIGEFPGAGGTPPLRVKHFGLFKIPRNNDFPTRKYYRFTGWSLDSTVDGGGTPVDYDQAIEVKGPTTVVANWIRQYTVSYKLEGADNAGANDYKERVYDTGTVFDKAPLLPQKHGWNFTGWKVVDEDGVITNSSMKPVFTLKKDTVYTALWREKYYRINFDPGRDSTANVVTRETKHYTRVTPAPTPKRLGYNFVRWNNATVGGVSVAPDAIAGENVASNVVDNTLVRTHTAAWSEKTYKVRYSGNGKNIDVNVKHFSSPTPPAGPARSGYHFDGWADTTVGGVNVKPGDTAGKGVGIDQAEGSVVRTHQAMYRKIHTVSFNTGGGTSISNQNIIDGEKATKPQNPTRTGYTFTGWNRSFDTPITGDTTFTAQWKINTYTATFNVNGGTPAKSSQTVNYNSSPTNPGNPTKTDYTFTGWSPSLSTKMTQNTTFTAQWRRNQYTVTFNANGGSGGTTRTVNSGNTVGSAPANPTRSGYVFTGWSGFSSSHVIRSNKTYYASWRKLNTYTATFVLDTTKAKFSLKSGEKTSYTKKEGTSLSIWATPTPVFIPTNLYDEYEYYPFQGYKSSRNGEILKSKFTWSANASVTYTGTYGLPRPVSPW